MYGHPNFLPNIRRNTLTCAHSRLHAHWHSHALTHLDTHTHTHTHPHTHTHNTLTHSLSLSPSPSLSLSLSHTHTHKQTSLCLHKRSNAVIITQNSYLGQLFANAPHTQTLRAHNMSGNVVELWKSAPCSVSYSSIAYMTVYSYFILTTLKNTC